MTFNVGIRLARKGNFLYAERAVNLFDDILAGKFTFAGHRVVVL